MGATSHALLPSAPSIATKTRSLVVFHLPNGATAPATMINKLHHKVHEPARSANIVPALTKNSLLSTSKFVDAGYTVVYDKNEVNYYEMTTTKVIASEAAVLRGWKCPLDKLWRVPLVPNVTNLNTDTILLNTPTGYTSLNAIHEVANNSVTRQHIDTCMHAQLRSEYLHNMYELPSIGHTIRYLPRLVTRSKRLG
jgi:hypothetical protein